MPVTLHSAKPGFAETFDAFLRRRHRQDEKVESGVAAIIEDVRRRGDEALLELTARFDRFHPDNGNLRLSASELAEGADACDSDGLEALEMAATRIEAFHRRYLPRDDRFTDEAGVTLGMRWRPLDSVGVYVPGGSAAYPSSVLMNVLPARVAGVRRVAMAVPAPHGVLKPLVLAAARRAGVDELYRMGGAQAVAALALGTPSVAPVDKITGPGNMFVTAAKRQLYGRVGIDMVAGPSEVLIIADGDNDADWLAMDLLAQAEHDEAAQAILMTDSGVLADAVTKAVARHLTELPRATTAGASWRDHGAVIVLHDLAEAPALADRIASEHLELAVAKPQELANRIRYAGAVFLGRHTPEAMGDYIAGPNHILPTARSARFSSGLSVYDFLLRSSLVSCSPRALRALGPAAATLARGEGLEAHARSITMRLERLN